MVNVDTRAATQLINSFANSFISGDDWSAVAPSAPFASSSGTFSVDEFVNDLWVPVVIQKKRKRRSAPECTPEDRCHSMFYRNYIQTAHDDVS